MITYSGDTVYTPSQFSLSLSNPLTDFSMVAQTPVVTVAAGATGTATLNLGSINGFNASVGLACTGPTRIDLQPESHLGHGQWKHHGHAYHRCIHACQRRGQGCRSCSRRIGWFAASGSATLGLRIPVGYSGTAAQMARLAEPGRPGRSHCRYWLRRWRQLVYADTNPDPTPPPTPLLLPRLRPAPTRSW